jgi:uncharacterized protein (DUF433 family)
MSYPASPYVEERNGGLYVAGTRVSLDLIFIRFQEGGSPERIAQSLPSLKLSQIYGVIAYYIENEKTIKEYLAQSDRELERSVPPLSQTDPDLFARLQAARRPATPERT